MPFAAGIYYQFFEGGVEGQRPPLVLLHGAGGTHLSWAAEIRHLAETRLYALDLPGHGKSNGRGLQSISAYGEAVLGWMAACGLHRAVLVGHSMGAAIALTLALEAPQHILGLGLVGAGARLRVAPALLEAASDPATYATALDLLAGGIFSPKTSPRLVELVQKRMAETRPSVFYGDFLACNEFDLTEQLGQVSQPALIVCGEQDRMTPPRYARFLLDHLPNAALVMIAEAGHMVMLERPLDVADALQIFLKRLRF
jgi:pimeloyl-ACP methyl ester carboxylesterase